MSERGEEISNSKRRALRRLVGIGAGLGIPANLAAQQNAEAAAHADMPPATSSGGSHRSSEGGFRGADYLDIRDFGAKGDGITKDTAAIQTAIDHVSPSGGTVVLSPGNYVSGTIHLRSNLTLRIERGAMLTISPDDGDFDRYEELPYRVTAPTENKPFPPEKLVGRSAAERRRRSAPAAYDNTDTTYFHYALLAADGIHDVSIEGAGEIFGNRRGRSGPKPIGFRNCEWISIRGITIRDSPNYALSLGATDHVEIEGVRIVNSHADGIDPDSCRFVRITNCYVDSHDDSICMKASWAPGKPRSVEHVVIANCILRTSCNHIKFGTETAGGLKNVSISNCVMLAREHDRNPRAAIAIESADGGDIDGVTVSNLSVDNAVCPIFIRLCNRGKGQAKPVPGSIKNIAIQNVVANGASLTSSISGIEAAAVQNVLVDNLSVTAAGGLTALPLDVPERTNKYPDGDEFGNLPALGLYVRHVDGLTLKNVKVQSVKPDGRPAVVLDDVSRLEMSGFESKNVPAGGSMLLFRNVAGALLYGNRLSLPVDAFLSVLGAKSEAIALRANDLHFARRPVRQSSEVPHYAISIRRS